ncbi:toxin-antitoxin system YwqK family antitoxin [candidate division KSB1 bacterium]
MDFIDDYTKGNTLSHKKEFMDFKDEFDVKSNVTVFIQTPKLYSHLYYYSKNEKRTEIQQNKEVIISFARIGFQLVSDGIKFKSRLMAEFDEKTMMNEELEKFEAAAENLFNKEFESLSFIIQPTNAQLSTSGSFKLFYDDSTLMAEGKISDGAVNGLIRSFYPGGNIKSSVNYMDGQAEGFAFFYYNTDKNDLKAEVQFRKNQIINVYKEYYESGARKAILNYENGQANGDAEFYYESGVLKMKGSYKNGVKKGKWKHFSETGQLMDKEKWQEGKIRRSAVDR